MYLALGRRFFANGAFPSQDPFVHSLEVSSWQVAHEWGSILFWYLAYDLGGVPAAILLKATLITFVFALPFRLLAREGRRSLTLVALVALAAYGGSHRFIERSSLLSDALTALLCFRILTFRAREDGVPRAALLFPLLFLAWVNLHPGFLLGLVVVAAWPAAGVIEAAATGQLKQRRPALAAMAAIFVACCLVLPINPAGWQGATYPFWPLLMSADPGWRAFKQSVYEWRPTLRLGLVNPQAWSVLMLTAMSAFVFLAAGVQTATARFRRFPVYELLVSAIVLYLAFFAARFVLTAAMILPMTLTSAYLRCGTPTSSRRSLAPVATWLVAMAIAAIGLRVAISGYQDGAGWRRPAFGIDDRVLPVAAAEFIERTRPGGNLFNEWAFGSYLAWRWDGERRLFTHGFVEDRTFFAEEYLAANRSRNDFDRIVSRYGIGAFLLSATSVGPNTGPLLHRILMSDPKWHLVFAGQPAMLFVKDLPENRDLIRNHSFRLHPRPSS